MNNLHEQWTISDNEEWFNEGYFFDTKEDAIEFGKTYEDFEGRDFFVGKIREVRMICDELAINVLEEIEGNLHCEDCVLDMLGIEVGVKHVTEYFICDDYIGNDEDEMFDIIKSINKSVKII